MALLFLVLVTVASGALVGLQPMFFGVGIAGLLLAVAVIWLVPTVWLTAVAILTSTLMVYRWDIGPFQISLYRIFLLFALGRIIAELLVSERKLHLDRLFWLLLIMVAWDATGLFYSENLGRGVSFVIQEIEFIVAYFVIQHSVQNRGDLSKLIKAFLGGVALAVILGFWQWLNVFVLGRPFQWPLMAYVNLSEERGAQVLAWVGELGPGIFRVGSVVGDPSNFAHLLALAVVIAVGRWLVTTQENGRRLPVLGFILVSAVMLLLTWGRGGLLAAGVALLLLLPFVSHRISGVLLRRVFLASVILLFSLFALYLLSDFLSSPYDPIGGLIEKTQRDFSSLFEGPSASVQGFARRVYLQNVAFEVWMAHPILGVGTGALPSHSDVLGVHNAWLARLAENGILGFLIVTAIFVELARLARRAWRNSRREMVHSSQWAYALALIAPLLFVQHLIFALTWGYWWFPFYIITFAFIDHAAQVYEVAEDPAPRLVAGTA